MAAKVAIHHPSRILLHLALMLAILVIHISGLTPKEADEKYVKMTLRVVDIDVDDKKCKAINVTCQFNKTIENVLEMGLNRMVKVTGNLLQTIVAAQENVDDGQAVLAKNIEFVGGPRWDVTGNIRDRWLTFILANFSDDDSGDYSCYLLFEQLPSNGLRSVSQLRTFHAYENDDIKFGARKGDDKLKQQTDVNKWIVESFKLGASVLACTVALAALAAALDRDHRNRTLKRQAAAAAATAATAAASEGPTEESEPAGPAAELATGGVALAPRDHAPIRSPAPRTLHKPSAPVVLEMVPVALKEQSESSVGDWV